MRRSSTWCSFAALFLAVSGTSCGGAPDDTGTEEVVTGSGEDELVTAREEDLPRLDVDLGQTTVSGLSSGAFMAVQMHVAHAGIVRGAAVFAGGPYLCAGGDVQTALSTCMKPGDDARAPDAGLAGARLRTLAASGLVDAPSELAKSKVFLFGGANDVTVAPSVMDSTRAFYETFVPAASVGATLRVPRTGHVFPTVASGDPCETPGETYLGRCGRDGAGEALSHLLGTLSPASKRASGRLSRFSQWRVAMPGAGFARDGFVYVPRSCARGEACKVHVAFHGCKQFAEGPVGERFVRQSGFLRWADTNHLVVLFPQTTTGPLNPNGCWDWWGYTGPAYATKLGPQIASVRAMLDALVAPNSARP